MGKTITPKYRLVMDGQTSTWRGRATAEKLEEYVMAYAKSLEVGGCNVHISEALGYVPYPRKARIETNTKRPVIVATWEAAMFQVW